MKTATRIIPANSTFIFETFIRQLPHHFMRFPVVAGCIPKTFNGILCWYLNIFQFFLKVSNWCLGIVIFWNFSKGSFEATRARWPAVFSTLDFEAVSFSQKCIKLPYFRIFIQLNSFNFVPSCNILIIIFILCFMYMYMCKVVS